MKRELSAAEFQCGTCANFLQARASTADSTLHYGRCKVTPMHSTTVAGQIIPNSSRPAARFDTDSCEKYERRGVVLC